MTNTQKIHRSTIGGQALFICRRLATFCVLWLVVGHAAVHAQNVLILQTSETRVDAAGGLVNLASEFTNAGATVVVQPGLEAAGTVNDATFTMLGGGRYDIVIMASAYLEVNASNWSAINAAIATRKANSFLMFNDGCCVAANLSAMVASVAATGAFTPTLGAQVFPGPAVPAILNTGALAAASFVGLDPFVGYAVQYLNNVPAANALYLAPGSPIPPIPGPVVNDVYALLVPTTQSYAGAGACLFVTVDLSPFIDTTRNSYSANAGKIAPAFLNAVQAGGACGIGASIAKAFAPVNLSAGDTSTLTISVQNANNAPINGLNVNDDLPAPLLVAGAATTTCTGGTLAAAVGGNKVTLSGSSLPVIGCTITVPVSWPVAQASMCTAQGTAVTNTIRPGVDFTTDLGEVNTLATAQLSCVSRPVTGPVTPVPTLSQWALATLSLLLGLFVWSQWAARRRS